MKKILFLLFCFPLFLFSQNWNQLGLDIDGETAGDQSGWSVSMSDDGNIMAIGAPNNPGMYANQDKGHVRVYENVNGSWNLIGQDIDGEAIDDESGFSVSLSGDGNTVAIGARVNNGNGNEAGHVRIYSFNGSSWVQLGQDIDGEASDDESGYSVSLSADGNTVAIGARVNDGNGSQSGHVRIYNYNGSSWNQLGDDIDGESAHNQSGFSVSLSSDGNIVAIGATGADGINGSNSGHVRVFENMNGVWVQIGQDIDGEVAGDQSGHSVSLSSDGNIVAIGARYNDGNGINTGHVRIYEWNGSSWTQVGADIDGEAVSDDSGWSVSLSSDGNTVAIGARDNDGNGTYSGHVRIYNYNGTSWNQLGYDIDGEAPGDHLGQSVSLNADGSIVAIGAYGNDGNGADAGHVRVYTNIVPVSGCTDSTALNYDPLANIDDGSCCYFGGLSVDTFNFTGSLQNFVIPNGVYEIDINMWGASGGNENSSYVSANNVVGTGGGLQASLSVSPGNTLYISAGGEGGNGYPGGSGSGAGGYNGGGTGGAQVNYGGGGGGGGATDIRIGGTSINDRVMVSGGGGGSAVNYQNGGDNGGNGGGLIGGFGFSSYGPSGGGGGTQYNFGTGASSSVTWTAFDNGGNGSFGFGGDGASSTTGGGGGGGYYGGGGGSWNGGGGGSSYTDATISSNVQHTQGGNLGNGFVIITYILPNCISGCTDSLALNYDANALIDDGSCIIPFSNFPDSISACDSVQICVDSIAGGSYLWDTSNIPPPLTPAIGDTYQGGLVFYLDGNGGGLISAPSNQSTGAEWGCYGTLISGADGTAIGTGSQNTIDIELGCATPGTAADLCTNLTLGGYSDWFLPSKDELREMYLNIGNGSSLGDVGGFNTNYFWTSTDTDNLHAWVMDFAVWTNGSFSSTGKFHTHFVRAIRAFSAPINTDTTNCVWVSNPGWNYITISTANGFTATDSVYVSINTPVSGSSSVTACDTYTWEGQTITSSGNLIHTYQSALGCDSVHTLSVTINNSTSNTTTITDCDSYTWPVNGTAYTSSGTYTDISTNSSGCTHTETLVLTINNSTSNSTTITDCDSYTWPVNGTAYTSSGTYTDISTNSSGCTHTETLVLIINNSISLTNTVSICFWDSITVGSNTYSQTGIYTDAFTAVNGCDSIITTNLNVSQQITGIISQLGMDIKANPTGGNMPYVYEWNTGEIIQQITPLVDGDYWVIVTDANGCVSDTSFFKVDWIHTSVEDFNIDRLSIYPNPSRDIFNIEFTSLLRQNLEIRIINSIGEIIYLENLENYTGEYSKSINLKEYSKAFYFLEIITNGGIINKKLILQ